MRPDHPNPDPEVTGLILAGGRGSRMGGADKGLLDFEGRPLVDWLAARLRPQVGALRVNANRHAEAYAALGFAVVADPALPGVDAFPGPLAGMLAGLLDAGTPWLCCVPCDSPLLPRDFVARMRSAVDATGADIGMASCDGRQPVFALLRRSLADDLAEALIAGERKIDRWFARHALVEVDFADHPEAFVNLNTPDDWAALAAHRAAAD